MTFLSTIRLTCDLDVGALSPIWANCFGGIFFTCNSGPKNKFTNILATTGFSFENSLKDFQLNRRRRLRLQNLLVNLIQKVGRGKEAFGNSFSKWRIFTCFVQWLFGDYQCDQKKLPNVYKSCPKMISLEK